MESSRFDRLTRVVSRAASRRAVLGLAAGALSGIVAMAGVDAGNRTTCRGNKKKCGKRCIPKSKCCKNRECAGGETCQNGSCRCPNETKPCDNECIPNDFCCNCATPAECQIAACDEGTCVFTDVEPGTPCSIGVCNGGVCTSCNQGASCTTPQPGVCSAGTIDCSTGVGVCVRTTEPSVEICGDGLDNDCDGVVDNGC